MSLKKYINSSIFFVVLSTQSIGVAMAGGGLTGGATEITQWINKIQLETSAQIQAGMAAVQNNQFVMQGVQLTKETLAQIDGALRLQVMYDNMTNPAWLQQQFLSTAGIANVTPLLTATQMSNNKYVELSNLNNAVGALTPAQISTSTPQQQALGFQQARQAISTDAASSVQNVATIQQATADASGRVNSLADQLKNGCNGNQDCMKTSGTINAEGVQAQLQTTNILADMSATENKMLGVQMDSSAAYDSNQAKNYISSSAAKQQLINYFSPPSP